MEVVCERLFLLNENTYGTFQNGINSKIKTAGIINCPLFYYFRWELLPMAAVSNYLKIGCLYGNAVKRHIDFILSRFTGGVKVRQNGPVIIV